jgi:hypothetical protein
MSWAPSASACEGVWKERPDRERLPGVIPDAQIIHLRELLDILDCWKVRSAA